VIEVTVTLVHGTFAKCAAWTQEGAPLCVELQERFGDSIVVDRFCWSGDNTVFARLIAGAELAKHMDRVKERYPSAKHYIIAHSHGGNVALYAAERAAQVDGVISLATPFFHASPRDDALMGTAAIRRGMAGATSFIVFLAATPMSWKTWLIITVFYSVVCALLGAVVSGLMGMFFRTSERLARFVTAKVPRKTLFCAFRGTGDEASLGLSAGQLFAWASTKLYSNMVRTPELNFFTHPLRHVPLPSVYWLLPAFAIGAVFTGLLWGPDESSSAALLLHLGQVGIAASVLMFMWAKTTFFDNFLYGISFILLFISSSVGAFLVGTSPPAEIIGNSRFGWMLGLGYSVAVDFYTEATPPGGPWPILQFPQHLNPSSQEGLAHSIYNNPEVRATVVECLERFLSNS
jgi:pimeloyl-ACP methyl ester carboxylesterase